MSRRVPSDCLKVPEQNSGAKFGVGTGMWLYTYIYIYIYIVATYICTNVYIYVWMRPGVWLHMYIYIVLYVCMNICIFMYGWLMTHVACRQQNFREKSANGHMEFRLYIYIPVTCVNIHIHIYFYGKHMWWSHQMISSKVLHCKCVCTDEHMLHSHVTYSNLYFPVYVMCCMGWGLVGSGPASLIDACCGHLKLLWID